MTPLPMRIGIVCYPTFGGSGVVATELGKSLAKQGHEVHFITYNLPVRLGSFHPRVFYHEVEVSKYPLFDYPPYELVLTSKMVDVVKAQNLDLLHVHYAIPHASAAVNAKRILAKADKDLPGAIGATVPRACRKPGIGTRSMSCMCHTTAPQLEPSGRPSWTRGSRPPRSPWMSTIPLLRF